jgi:hypothetical protein
VLVGLMAVMVGCGLVAPPWAGAYRLPDTGQNKCYDNVSEIPCPEPGEPFYGQDAQVRGAQPAYHDNGDGTVTDLNTALVWQKSDAQNASSRTWQEAVDYCGALSLGGRKDWRLPTVKELFSLLHLGRTYPAIDIRYFPKCRSDDYYWSSSTRADDPDDAWIVGFGGGIVDYHGKSNDDYVRCVRGGP